MNLNLKLGQPIKARAYLVRKTERSQTGSMTGSKTMKVWRRAVWPEPQAGIVVGLRTVSDGLRVYLGEEGVAYKATAHHRVAVVAFSLARAPVHVLLDDVTP